jgi:hypothetical protein
VGLVATGEEVMAEGEASVVEKAPWRDVKVGLRWIMWCDGEARSLAAGIGAGVGVLGRL